MALNVIMLGPPGAGKGTQAERFARGRGIPKISTGDILREAVQAGTELGRRARAVMDRGELVNDEVMIGIVRERLDRPDARGGFVLDGFPRTIAQAAALDRLMESRDPLIIVNIAVPESELVRRMLARLVCEDCGSTAASGDQTASAADAMVLPPVSAAGADGAAAVASQTEPLRCRRCGGRLVQRADDTEAVVRERLRVYHDQSKPLLEYYCSRPTFRTVSGAQAPERVGAELAGAIVDAANGVAGPVASGGTAR